MPGARAYRHATLYTSFILFASFHLVLALLAAETVSQPFLGIRHVDRTEDSPRAVHLHVIQVDLSAPGVRFKLTPPAGSRETVRQTTVDFLVEQKAQVGVNAHFFEPYPTDDSEVFLIGLAASDGVVYSDFEAPRQSYALVKHAPALNIDAENRASLLHSAEGAYTAVAGSAQVITGGRVTIPRYQDGELTPGGPGGYSNEKSWYDVPTARTLIGLSEDRRMLTILTVDRSGESKGLTVGEAASLLAKDYGVFDALNLDGGGSTTLVLAGQGIVNQPTGGEGGRRVGSNLVIFARPAPVQ